MMIYYVRVLPLGRPLRITNESAYWDCLTTTTGMTRDEAERLLRSGQKIQTSAAEFFAFAAGGRTIRDIDIATMATTRVQ